MGHGTPEVENQLTMLLAAHNASEQGSYNSAINPELTSGSWSNEGYTPSRPRPTAPRHARTQSGSLLSRGLKRTRPSDSGAGIDPSLENMRAGQKSTNINELRTRVALRSGIPSKYSEGVVMSLKTLRKRSRHVQPVDMPQYRDQASLNRYMLIFAMEVHVLFPVINLDNAMAQYTSAYDSNNTSVSSAFMALVNNVFAIASLLDRTIPDDVRHSVAEFFHSQANAYLSGADPEADDVEKIQAQLLSSLYLHRAGLFDDAWLAIGATIRQAQTLGLHLDVTADAMASFEDKCLVHRIWHGAVLLERMMALHLGFENLALTSNATKSGLAYHLSPADRLDHIHGVPGDSGELDARAASAVVTDYFFAASKLYDFLPDIVAVHASLLQPTNGNAATATATTKATDHLIDQITLTKILDLEKRMSIWELELPTFLLGDFTHSPSNPAAAPDARVQTIRKQHHLLRLQFLYLKMILFRPVLKLVASLQVPGCVSSSAELPLGMSLFGLAADRAGGVAAEVGRMLDEDVEGWKLGIAVGDDGANGSSEQGRQQGQSRALLLPLPDAMLYAFTAGLVLVAARSVEVRVRASATGSSSGNGNAEGAVTDNGAGSADANVNPPTNPAQSEAYLDALWSVGSVLKSYSDIASGFNDGAGPSPAGTDGTAPPPTAEAGKTNLAEACRRCFEAVEGEVLGGGAADVDGVGGNELGRVSWVEGLVCDLIE